MSQWFRGRLEGHYVGTPAGKPGVSQYGSAERYTLRIYRAVVRDIEPLDGVPEEPPEDVPEGCFYQAEIEDTRMLGIRPRSCFEGPIYDVAVSDLNVTHSTKKGAKTYGRLEGEVYGRYLMPPPGEFDEAAMAPESELSERPLASGDSSVVAGEEKPLSEERRHRPAVTEEADGRIMEALHPPTPPPERDEREPSHVPIPFLIIVMAVVLGLAGGWEPALLWLAAFIPIQIIRLILTGLFKVTPGQRVFGAVLVVVQVACLGLILLDWWSTGCKAINVWAVSGIGVTALIASVLPSTLPLLCAGGSLGLVLFLWYADVGVKCEGSEPKPPAAEKPAQRPTVHDPGVPRTNADGSWPRRPPRTR